ncbi:MAG TPA: hypothetical protein VJ731_13945 [Terriglobales bacterium]|nr:hypothetical protein [Terriglobales bacterium]
MHNSQQLDGEQLNLLDLIGGESLAGSGFEAEQSQPEFSDSNESED